MKFGKLVGLFIIFILSLSILPLNAIDNITLSNVSSNNNRTLNANSKIHTITPHDPIQEVIDNANDGDIIELTGNGPDSDDYDGLYYYSDIKVNKKLVIRAAPNAHPIIALLNFSKINPEGFMDVDGFIITADGVELNGLEIMGAGSKSRSTPISINNCQNVIVNNCTIHDVYTRHGAISISNSLGRGFNNITNCKFYNNANGYGYYEGVISIFGANNIVSDCIFTKNTADYGAVHIYTDNNVVKNCLISNNSGTIPGIYIGDDTDLSWSIKGNNVTGCTITNNKCNNNRGAVSIISSGSSNFINNNRIFNNSRDLTVSSIRSEYNNVDANWWGDNTVGNKSNKVPENNYVVSVEPGFDKNNFVLNYKLKLNDSSNLNDKIPAFDGCVYVNDNLNQTFDASINHEFAFNPGENVKIVVDNMFMIIVYPSKRKMFM
ncbi:MAG: right-handed parallel beta-helix repeat-containing protein [Methanobrevibacter sp.]|nr:right-handed parallel beta-helix repeat-containing protein [Candidatus Methanovirga australis]